MRKIIFMTTMLFAGTLFAGCAGAQKSNTHVTAPGCEQQNTVINTKKVNTNFCIKKIIFQPTQYSVTVNGQSVFEGTDYTSVLFEKKVREGVVKGACDGIVEIQDVNTSVGIAISQLPTELVSGCAIKASASGNSLPFDKNAACDKVFHKSLVPMLGKVYPAEIGRRCVLTLDNQKIFENEFKF